MISLWHHDDIISGKSVNDKLCQLESTNNFIFGSYYKYNILFLDLGQKSKIFERQLKNGTLFVKKANIMFMTSSKQGNVYYVKSNLPVE